MPSIGILLILVVVFSLAFDFINGFHDTANAVATVIATRVLPPAVAIFMSGFLNLTGAMVGTHVAATISKGIVDPKLATEPIVLAAVIGAIVWNLITWFYGIPSSSSHALIGGLCGAAVAAVGPGIVMWNGVFQKVVIPLVLSPVIGFCIGLFLMTLITIFFAKSSPKRAGPVFHNLQLLSSMAMSFSHGQNDGQKTMGVITLALFANGVISKPDVPFWVMLSCALAMGFGTASGGYRIIKTMGHKIIRLEPVQGFAAETSGAAVILGASALAMPVSTTHVIAGSVFGVGVSKGVNAVRWQVAINMVMAWVITLPASAFVAACTYLILHAFGLTHLPQPSTMGH